MSDLELARKHAEKAFPDGPVAHDGWQWLRTEQRRICEQAILAALPEHRVAVIDGLISELLQQDFVLHNPEGEISYHAVGEWLRKRRTGNE